MRDTWAGEETWSEIVESFGRPIGCSRCWRNGRQLSVVAFLTEVDGRPAVTPTVRFNPEDSDWSRMELPVGQPPETRAAVELHCHRCGKSCGQWRAVTLARRADRGKAWVPAT